MSRSSSDCEQFAVDRPPAATASKPAAALRLRSPLAPPGAAFRPASPLLTPKAAMYWPAARRCAKVLVDAASCDCLAALKAHSSGMPDATSMSTASLVKLCLRPAASSAHRNRNRIEVREASSARCGVSHTEAHGIMATALQCWNLARPDAACRAPALSPCWAASARTQGLWHGRRCTVRKTHTQAGRTYLVWRYASSAVCHATDWLLTLDALTACCLRRAVAYSSTEATCVHGRTRRVQP